MRQSEDFHENFSIGLVYQPNEEPGSFQLLRCNGRHGGERVHPHHAVFHVHRCSAADLNAGYLEPRNIEAPGSYASFLEAQALFCRMVNVTNADHHFPGISQMWLAFSPAPPRPAPSQPNPTP